jgi:hypothetical protein
MQQKDKLWLFWRGGRWFPTFSWTENRIDWAPPRELVTSAVDQRPYCKYVGDGKTIFHGILTDGHPMAFKNSLYYFRYEGGDLFNADGGKIASLASVPIAIKKLDHVYNYTDAGGRAWAHDIALTSQGRPRIVYTRRTGGPTGDDTFYYAYHNGEKWVTRKIVEAGKGRPSFTSGGATLNHEDPRFVYLSRTIGPWNQVEEWFTPDEGRTWTTKRLTNDPNHYSIRPVRPRHLREYDRVLFTRGDETTIGFTNYRTRVWAHDYP